MRENGRSKNHKSPPRQPLIASDPTAGDGLSRALPARRREMEMAKSREMIITAMSSQQAKGPASFHFLARKPRHLDAYT